MKSVIKDRRIVGVQRAAKYAGVSRWTVYDWITKGKLPMIKYPSRTGGTLIKIDLDVLDKFIATHTTIDYPDKLTVDRALNNDKK